MTFAQTDSEPFSNMYKGIALKVLFTRSITPPPWKVLSFLYTCTSKFRLFGNSSGVSMDLSTFELLWYQDFLLQGKRIAGVILPLMPFMLIDINLPLIILCLVVSCWNVTLFLGLFWWFSNNLFSMLMTDMFSKKESEKFIISHVGHIHVADVVCTCSSIYSLAWMPEHLLCTQLLQLSHLTAGSLCFTITLHK